MRDKLFYLICFGFIFGVLYRSFIAIDFYLLLLASVIFIALFLFFLFISKNKVGVLIVVFILSIFLGIFRFNVSDKSASEYFQSKVGIKTEFSGIIIDEVDKRENNQKFTVEVKRNNEKTKILITSPLEEIVNYGDDISFIGKLEKPVNFLTDQDKEFDYVNYLRKDGIFFLMKNPKIEIISNGNGNFIKNSLFSFKEKFLEKINFAIPNIESLFMGGLILGERATFDKEMREKFINTGTIHLVALSGYNVTIVAEWIMKAFYFLPSMLGFGMGILGIILFVVMSGGASTAVRAGIMAVLVLIARATGRNYDVARALILAGVVMIIFNPFVLVYDVSFQLSFIATVAIIFVVQKIEKYFYFITEKFGLRDVISVTFSAYLFVLPFILYKMGNLSIVALPANILILPFIPLTMVFGFLTGFTGLVWSGLSIPFGYLSYLLLHYELGVVNFFSALPFSVFIIPNFPVVITVMIYVFFIYHLFGRNIKEFFKFEER